MRRCLFCGSKKREDGARAKAAEAGREANQKAVCALWLLVSMEEGGCWQKYPVEQSSFRSRQTSLSSRFLLSPHVSG